IMGTAVSVLVLAMSSLVVDTQEGRGHSIADTAAHDLGEAIQAKVPFTTKLSGAARAASGAPAPTSVVHASGSHTHPSSTAPHGDHWRGRLLEPGRKHLHLAGRRVNVHKQLPGKQQRRHRLSRRFDASAAM